jgi:hypothetical protein
MEYIAMATQQTVGRGQQTVIKTMGAQNPQAQQVKQMQTGLGGLLNFGTIDWDTLAIDLGKGVVDFLQANLLPKIAARNGTLAMLAAIVLDSAEAWLNSKSNPVGTQGQTRGMQPPTP